MDTHRCAALHSLTPCSPPGELFVPPSLYPGHSAQAQPPNVPHSYPAWLPTASALLSMASCTLGFSEPWAQFPTTYPGRRPTPSASALVAHGVPITLRFASCPSFTSYLLPKAALHAPGQQGVLRRARLSELRYRVCASGFLREGLMSVIVICLKGPMTQVM